MRRRKFLILGTAFALPTVSRAQQTQKIPVIGFLGANTAATAREWTAAFVEQLRQHGWIDGQTMRLEYRWAEGRVERFAAIAAEFVDMKVTVIATSGTAPSLAAKKATSDIPIVFASASDPVEVGLVASLARPGGNITGLATQLADLAAKRLELFREALPGLRRVAVIYNANAPASALDAHAVKGVADKLGLGIALHEIREVGDIAPVIDRIKGQADALFIVSDPLVFVHRARINTLALGAGLPTMHSFREHVQAGGLMAYGPDFVAMNRRAGDFVDRILRGTKPGDIPVEQPQRFSFAVNLISAKVLGVHISPSLLARADEVIE